MSEIPEDVMKKARECFIRCGNTPDSLISGIYHALLEAKREERERDKWQPIETAPRLRAVLVAYKGDAGNWVCVKAWFVPKFTHEFEAGIDQLEPEYHEEVDAFFWPEGWYELIENWDDLSSIAMQNRPQFWQPLPPPPAIKGASHEA